MDSIGYKVSQTNIHIENSYTIRKVSEMIQVLEYIKKTLPSEYPVNHLSIISMLMEWSAHNLLYRLNYKPKQTASVDLNVGESFFRKILYYIIGVMGLLFPCK